MRQEKKEPLHTDADYIRYIKSQPREKVMGNTGYIPFCGKTYTVLYNMNPVSIDFDGQYHEYPRDVARFLQRKLDAIAVLNVQVTSNQKIG